MKYVKTFYGSPLNEVEKMANEWIYNTSMEHSIEVYDIKITTGEGTGWLCTIVYSTLNSRPITD